MAIITRYGLNCQAEGFSETEQALFLEMEAIRRGGKWTDRNGVEQGFGLATHYKYACQLLWPHIDWHRWTELCNSEIRRPNAKVTVLMGPGSTGKTCTAAWEYLLEYYCSPHDTLILVSSTDLRGLDLRVYGEIKSLHEMAKQRFDWLPGYAIDSKRSITTDELEEDEFEERVKARDIRKGVIAIPTVQGGRQVGLGKWVGIKQKHLRLVADDCPAMSASFLSAFANLNNNVDFQAIILGNPDDILDPLGVAAEPVDGWSSHMEPTTTVVWDNKFYNGRTVNLVGTNSPNFDFPQDQPPRYPYLNSQKKINETLSAFAKDSFEYYSQCVGVMKISQMSRRVITRDLCRQFHAQDDAIWQGEERTKLAALDASYGGDRCVGGDAEFGMCMDGKVRLQFHPPHIVPVKVSKGEPMAEEDSISHYEKDFCESKQITPENFFHDSTGRGSLGTSLARIWSAQCNPVEFGGSPTKRPVTMDTFTNDKVTGEFRLKRCDEHYSKFVSELWYSLRYAIEADQIRGLPEDVMNELCMRQWDRVAGDKIEVESKLEMKERIRKSPDLGDWCFVEGTLVLTPRGYIPINDLQQGDEVITPFGITTINELRIRTARVITEVSFSDGRIISGIGEHKILDKSKGWVRLDSLSFDNDIESDYNLPIWNLLNLLFTRESSIEFKRLADIIKAKTTTVKPNDFYIELFGLSTMEVFLKIIVSITKTAIGQIIESKILSWLKKVNTPDFTFLRELKEKSPHWLKAIGWPSLALQNGTAQNLGSNGTLKTPPIIGENYSQKNSNALNAAKHSQEYASRSALNIVHCPASKKSLGGSLNALKECVLCVAKNLLVSNTLRRIIVPVTVRQLQLQELKKVYNLTLNSHNVYYANGILVQNCAIILEGARRRGFSISKLGNAAPENKNDGWAEEIQELDSIIKAGLLSHA